MKTEDATESPGLKGRTKTSSPMQETSSNFLNENLAIMINILAMKHRNQGGSNILLDRIQGWKFMSCSQCQELCQ